MSDDRQQMQEKIDRLRGERRRALRPGSEAAYARLAAEGRLTARERLDVLLDPGSFVELGVFDETQWHEFGMQERRVPGDGVVAGHGKIDGRMVCVYSEDVTVLGGSVGMFHGRKMTEIIDLAIKTGVPVITLMESPGARIQEAIGEVIGRTDLFYQNVRASGVVPQTLRCHRQHRRAGHLLGRPDGLHLHGRGPEPLADHGPGGHP